MEVVQELFVTAFVAIIFSFVVAKIVSMATAGGDDEHRVRSYSSESAQMDKLTEEVKFEGGLRVRSTESRRRVQFVEEAVEKVEVEKAAEDVGELEGDKSVEKSENLCRAEEYEEKRVDSTVMSDYANRIDAEETSEVVGLPENSSEEGCMAEEVLAEIVGGTEVDEIEEVATGARFDGLVAEERCERTEVDKFYGPEEKNVVTGSTFKEKIIENAGTDDHIVGGSEGDVVAAQVEFWDVVSGERQKRGIEGLDAEGVNKEDLVGEEEDDWEGIERSGFEKVFAAAADLVSCGDKDERLSNLDNDVQMQLYGLHKVATEGPCYEPQPMALKVSARAKWNAWQRLGNMSPEVAMEQYISLLSDKVPGWMEGQTSSDGKANSLESRTFLAPYPDIGSYPSEQLNWIKERKLELESDNDSNLSGS